MTTNTQPQTQQSGGDDSSAQIAAMKQLSFDLVDTVYGGCYVKKVAEDPPHLTNGKSYLQLTRNQADEILQLIQAREREAEKHCKKQFAKALNKYGIGLPLAANILAEIPLFKPQAGEGGEV
jgi:hypothetical protein